MPAPTAAAQKIVAWETRRRRVVLALAVGAAALLAGSYFLPWWNFALIAPQYPKGLHLVIHLTGVEGDVSEIDVINHYIGMHSMGDAASVERALSHWIVGGLSILMVVGVLLAGRKVGNLLALLGLILPVGFVADTAYWMYHAGHDLDPRAPIHLKPFMPTVLGEGKVGQFLTMATPAPGFYLALGSALLLGLAIWQRRRVCNVCPAHDDCGVTCSQRLVGTPS